MKKVISLLLIFALLLCFASCNAGDSDVSSPDNTSNSVSGDQDPNAHRYALFTMKDYGSFVVELYCDEAPITCNNFISLVEKKFYDGLTIHRLYQDLIIQGGDPDGNGTGGPGYSIKGEFEANGVQNNVSHTRGTISMARVNDYNSAGSQFFIMLQDYKGWDGLYAAFGRVISGMEVVDAIGAVSYNAYTGVPDKTIIIESIVMIDNPDEYK